MSRRFHGERVLRPSGEEGRRRNMFSREKACLGLKYTFFALSRDGEKRVSSELINTRTTWS